MGVVDAGAVVACHCLECQRRSGSPFGVGAYCTSDQVKISGIKTKYNRPADSGETLHSYFCPRCGIAVGAFADPQFLAPIRSVWEQSMHSWIRVECAQQHFSRGRDS